MKRRTTRSRNFKTSQLIFGVIIIIFIIVLIMGILVFFDAMGGQT